MKNDDLYAAAIRAIQALFNDTDVSVDVTRANLETLKEEIDVLIDTLPEDDE